MQTRYSEIKTKRSARFDWSQFDALPRPVRDALNDAALCYATNAIFKRYREGVPVHKLVAAIIAADQNYLVQLKAVRAAEDERREAEAFLKECGL